MSSLPAVRRRKLLNTLSPAEAEALLYDWRFWARPEQLAPDGDWWTIWLVMAGRGYGKTRSGAEFIRAGVDSGHYGRVALVAEDAGDARDVMVEGPAGVLSISPPGFRPHYEPSKRRLTWPNGARATTYSAKDPDQLRGPEHDLAWADEVAKWPYREAWSNLMLGVRQGRKPRVAATTTPRPRTVVRDLVAREGRDVAVTRGTTWENAENLAASFMAEVVSLYEGTMLGAQELEGRLIEEIPGALWNRRLLEARKVAKVPPLARVVLGIDPAVSSGEEASETGLSVAARGEDGRGYVLYSEGVRLSPDGWARRAVQLYTHFGADRVVAEVNNGGDMVEHTLRTVAPQLPITQVHASRGKRTRAEPIAALFEQGRALLYTGGGTRHDDLEDQCCSYTGAPGEESPDLMDAMVWALTELMLTGGAPAAAPGGAPEPLRRRLKGR